MYNCTCPGASCEHLETVIWLWNVLVLVRESVRCVLLCSLVPVSNAPAALTTATLASANRDALACCNEASLLYGSCSRLACSYGTELAQFNNSLCLNNARAARLPRGRRRQQRVLRSGRRTLVLHAALLRRARLARRQPHVRLPLDVDRCARLLLHWLRYWPLLLYISRLYLLFTLYTRVYTQRHCQLVYLYSSLEATIPTAPVNLTATANRTSLTLSWSAPLRNAANVSAFLVSVSSSNSSTSGAVLNATYNAEYNATYNVVSSVQRVCNEH